MNTRESISFGWTTIVITVFVVAAVIIGSLMYLGVMPTLLGLERNAVQNSRQYVESKQTLLLNLVEEYESAEKQISQYRAADAEKYADTITTIETQQKALLNRIEKEAELIPADEIPPSVRELISRHRG